LFFGFAAAFLTANGCCRDPLESQIKGGISHRQVDVLEVGALLTHQWERPEVGLAHLERQQAKLNKSRGGCRTREIYQDHSLPSNFCQYSGSRRASSALGSRPWN